MRTSEFATASRAATCARAMAARGSLTRCSSVCVQQYVNCKSDYSMSLDGNKNAIIGGTIGGIMSAFAPTNWPSTWSGGCGRRRACGICKPVKQCNIDVTYHPHARARAIIIGFELHFAFCSSLALALLHMSSSVTFDRVLRGFRLTVSI